MNSLKKLFLTAFLFRMAVCFVVAEGQQDKISKQMIPLVYILRLIIIFPAAQRGNGFIG
ncbi:MAG: hypothetical protein JXJ04_17680 [Spirochaetales bacterium]|nr:hypothetical protein [Spirochaetales bacterium]